MEVTIAIDRPRNIPAIMLEAGEHFESYGGPPPWETPPKEYTFLWDSSGTSGTTTIRVWGDSYGVTAMDTVSVEVDQPPTLAILSPAAGSILRGEVPITLAITDEPLPRTVTFNGIDAERRGDLYFWDSTEHPDGPTTWKATVVDAVGNRAEAQIEVTVDNNGPTVEVRSPLPDADVGPRVQFELRAEDTSGVGRITAWVNDEETPRLQFTAAPWHQLLELSDLQPGAVRLRAQAEDLVGNTSETEWTVNLVECDSDGDASAARNPACGGDDCDDQDPGVPALLPCTPTDDSCADAAEPNNSAPGARLAQGTREYRACSDEDYFSLELADGELARVEVRFHEREGALDPRLEDLRGAPLGTQRALERGVAWSVLGPATAVLHVPAGDQLYEVTTHSATAPACNDAWDPNDSSQRAATLAPGTHNAQLCQGASDWYRLGLVGVRRSPSTWPETTPTAWWSPSSTTLTARRSSRTSASKPESLRSVAALDSGGFKSHCRGQTRSTSTN